MRIAVDALSATNLSGRRVLLGHLEQIAESHRDRHHFCVLVHPANRDLITEASPNLTCLVCPPITQHWVGRTFWQWLCLESRLNRHHIDLVLSPTGAPCPGTRRRQIVLAQNPWCFVADFHTGPALKLKAALQRWVYRKAQHQAWALFCNSHFLAQLYAANSGLQRREPILPNGIDASVFTAAQADPGPEDRPLQVLTVSVMTPHKAIEGVIDALALLHQRGVPASLSLVGPWANASYRHRIEQRIQRRHLSAHVSILGHVSDSELHRLYSRARVFCLLSRCESFGLPAVEAQAFGTPAVVADAAAAPEIVGPGGLVVPPGDPEACASALQTLLCDPKAWRETSAAARANAERFRWSRSSRPLVALLASLDSDV